MVVQAKIKQRWIVIDQEVYDLISHDCLQELLRNHPELLKTKITFNKIVYHMAKYYIDDEP